MREATAPTSLAGGWDIEGISVCEGVDVEYELTLARKGMSAFMLRKPWSKAC